MRNVILAAAFATTALAAATPALAQDRAPFTGLRVEGLAGYDHVKDGSGQDSGSSDGFVYGAGVGYDIQAGGAVLGVEGEITGSTADTRSNNLLATGDSLRVSAGRDLYAGVRAGYALSPRALAYVKGGYTNARVDVNYVSATGTVEDHRDLEGYRVGAGLEYQTSANTFVKGEYRYSHYGRLDGYDIDADRHQLLAGVGLRF